MQRREFLGSTLSASLAGGAAAGDKPPAGADAPAAHPVTIEHPQPGQPHRGKVLATIAPHSDDHSILAGGTIAKLIAEGYTGYLIRTSNDEMDSYDLTTGPDDRRQRGRQPAHGRRAGHQTGVRPQLPQPLAWTTSRGSNFGPGSSS